MEEGRKILTVARDYRSDRRDERQRASAGNAADAFHRAPQRGPRASQDAVAEFDPEYTCLRWLEPAHRKMTGWPLEEVCRLD
jgi:hypothetical protein